MDDRTVKVVWVRVGKEPETIEIPATLDAQQALVDGLIEPVALNDREGIDLVINEEGLVIPLPYNRHVRARHGWIPIMGDFYVARWAEGEIVSLSEVQVLYVLNHLQTESITRGQKPKPRPE